MSNRAYLALAGIVLLAAACGFRTSVAANAPRPEDDSLAGVANLPPAIHPTRLDYSKFDAPEAVTVITQDDIRLAGFIDVSDIFRSVPGFRVVDVGNETRVSYHGTAARLVRRLLVRIDGRNVLVGDSDYVEFNRLPVDLPDIARVTITRGPNGSAFGDNAFLCSIDFQTIGRDDPRGVTIRAGGGHNGRRRIGGSVNEQLGEYDLTLSGGDERDGGFDYFDRARTRRPDDREVKRALLSLQRESSQHSIWRLDANLYDSHNETGIHALSFSGAQEDKGEFVAISNRREIGETSRLDWFISYNRQREHIRNSGCYTPAAIAQTRSIVTDPALLAQLLSPTLFVPELIGAQLEDTCFFTDLGIDSARTETELQYESQRGPWRYLVGGSVNRTTAESAEYFAGRTETQNSYRVFTESDLALGAVHTSLGVMAQHSSNVEHTEFAGRAALSWQFVSNQSLRYSYARSFRIPSLRETEIFWTGEYSFGRRDEPQSAYPVSLPIPPVTSPVRVTPETIDSNEIGYFGTFLGSSTSVDLKVFSDRIHDPISASLIDFSPPPLNGQPFTLSGAEVEASYRLSDTWRVSGQYSYLINNARDPTEQELQGRQAGSILVSYSPAARHAFSVAYYGNSTISGHAYGRYDFVYNYTRPFEHHLFRSQLIWQHHLDRVEGIATDPNPITGHDEGYFAHLDQVFALLEVTF